MADGIADETRRESGGEHRADAVVAGEVDRLVPGPQQGTVTLHPAETGAHEEHRLVGLVATGNGLCVDGGPQHRPAVMRQHRVAAVGEAQVDRQIFPEIGHPPGDIEIEHLTPDDAIGKPRARCGAGEVDHCRVELAEIDMARRVVVQVEGKMLAVDGLLIEHAIDRQIGVGIREEADALAFQRGDAGRQVGVARGVPAPVPEQAPAEARLAHAAPVLAPQSADRRTRGDDLVEPAEAVRTGFQPDDGAVDRPVREGSGLSEDLGQPRHESWQAGLGKEHESRLAFPDLHAMRGRIGEIEDRIGARVEMDGPPAGREVGRLRIVGRPIVAAGVPQPVHLLRNPGRLVAPDARLAGPHREAAAVEPQVAHLLATTPDRFSRAHGEADGDPIQPRVDGADRQALRPIDRLDRAGRDGRSVRGVGELPPPLADRPAPAGRNGTGRGVRNREIAAIHRHARGPCGEGKGRRLPRMDQ